MKRIEVVSGITDTRALTKRNYLKSLGFPVKEVSLADVYTIDAELPQEELRGIASMLTNPVFQRNNLDSKITPPSFDYAVETGFLPGVTDNIGSTARETVEDSLGRHFEGQTVHTSELMFLSGVSGEQAIEIAASLANPIIQRTRIKSRQEFEKDNGMEAVVPRVRLQEQPKADLVDLLNASDEELTAIGKQGIANPDGFRRGPLALDLTYMHAIKNYFAKLGRNPTDVELESLAQTWSEHCHHTIFADAMDEIQDGLFRHFIKRATNEIRRLRGRNDICVSVFTDNSGAIVFDEEYLVTHKVETHNSPSALDPFGGAITGIVGVNRDAIGFGLGALPIINVYGYCFGIPTDETPLYKGKNKTQKMLSPRRIMDGVIQGVNVGGNCSGIPTPQGFVFFDSRYAGKPLVFVGTLGLIPKESNGKKLYEKQAQPGDYIVMIGGRVGKDGIHGATFSSEAMDSGSPATAVQIGDPITQKKLSDAITKEARDLGLYTSITDNGAGGLSCSVAEMAKECNGCHVDLDKVPLKYQGLQPWEIWISESQERMTLAIPKDKWDRFSALMERRGVETTVIGKFTDSGKCIVDYKGKRVMDVDMDFLHNGLPPRPMTTTFSRKVHEEPDFPLLEDLTESLYSMLGRYNIASTEFISNQYDHEVQGGSVIKSLQGRGRVNGDATITRPVLSSRKGIVISQGINPSYSDIDTYHMAAASIDTAVRNAIAIGARLEHIALLDNFCWSSSDEPGRLGQLKRAAQACYDISIEFQTPFISGKDSMFNDFKGYDENGNPIKISVPPTLLVSSVAVMEDVEKAVSLDAKFAGDMVYVLGETKDELGSSEYFAMKGEQERGKEFIGNNVPEVDPVRNRKLYNSLSAAIEKGLVASSQSIHRGGLAVALAKTAIGGMLGLEVNLEEVKGELRDDFKLYSESQGRILVTIAPENTLAFENIMQGNSFARIGTIRDDERFVVRGSSGKEVVSTTLENLSQSYKSTFGGF